MLRLGERQSLEIVKIVDFGVYLADPAGHDREEKVLLPGKQVPPGAKLRDIVDVFLYRDSSDRMIATTAQSKLVIGQLARLKVKQVGKIGAFLDWGLEKDLLLPFKEQLGRVRAGEECLVKLYVDKSKRLCASMDIYHDLACDSPYQKDDKVTGFIYEVNPELGAFVAVDDCYSAMIPKKEMYGKLVTGQEITARVTEVKPDGKLSLSVREKAYLQMETDAEKLLAMIEEYDGVLPFNDKASPELIRRETQMSKNEFKRAVGNLLKAGKIEIAENTIHAR
ncbi:MAG: S1-like domain-containing RNA-binding protein [Lachnospiraceae bacterium]|nr:S1-like domain-containing RNA-binding protein [Lachnospiraceae bacterium]